MNSRFVATVSLAVIGAAMSLGVACGQTPVYQNPAAPLEDRVSDLFGRLTQDEKLSLLSGTGYSTQPIPRLGVPPMEMVDAGQGVRGGDQGTQGPATLFPSGVVLARSWDPSIASEVGQAIGEEAQTKGTGAQVLLGPDVNIHRSPLGGRDGESFTEDPYLNGQMAAAFIRGVQTSGTAACVKHFICNNEEGDRNTVNVIVDERALHEIYLVAFKAGIEQGHAWTLMASYNKINGFYATANHHLIDDYVMNEWDFDGLAMSDWGAVHETNGVVNAGLDLEMPGGDWLTASQLAAALQSGAITQAEIDNSDKRVLRTIIRVGLLDPPRHPTPAEMVNSPEHQRVAYKAATEGIVLLKDENSILPLDKSAIKSIAVIGPAANGLQGGADGSPGVQPFTQSEPLDAITALAGPGVTVNFEQGLTLPATFPSNIPVEDLAPPGGAAGAQGFAATYYASPDLSGATGATSTDSGISFGRNSQGPALAGGASIGSARWQATITAPETGTYSFGFFTNSGCRIIVAGTTVVDSPNASDNYAHLGTIALVAGQTYPIEVDLLNAQSPLRGRFGWILPAQDDISAAAAAAAKSDVAIVFVTTHGTDGEGRDRPSMALPGDQDKLIEAVAAANKRTIVVINSGSPVLMTDWIKSVPGLVDAGFPGERGGAAIADVLFGNVDPSGKLTDTVGVRREDYPDYGNFPGTNDTEHYAEGIYVGYRHFDKAHIAPLFPFGYGLSYTKFKYSNLKLSAASIRPFGELTATMTVKNTGKREGAEVVELYVNQPVPTVDRPVRELKGFKRVDLQPGQAETVSFTVTARDLAYFDVSGMQWKADPGAYEVEIGASSRDIRLKKQFLLSSAYKSATND